MIRMILPRHVALAPVIRRHVKDFKSANANTRQRQWWYSYFLGMLGIPLVSIIVAAHSAAVSFMNRWTDDVMCSMCLQTNDYVPAQLTHNWHLACRRSYFQDMSPFLILAPFWQINTCPHYKHKCIFFCWFFNLYPVLDTSSYTALVIWLKMGKLQKTVLSSEMISHNW